MSSSQCYKCSKIKEYKQTHEKKIQNQTWWWNICITHEKSTVSSCLKWSKTRNTSWPKEVSTLSFFFLFLFSPFFSFLFFYRKKIISTCTPIRQQAPYVINVMTIASQITAQPCNSLLCYNDLTIKCIIPLSNKIRKTALQKRKCPKISSSSASIYISICIYTYTQSQRYTRLCWKTSCFFHKVIHTLGHHHLEHIFIQ